VVGEELLERDPRRSRLNRTIGVALLDAAVRLVTAAGSCWDSVGLLALD